MGHSKAFGLQPGGLPDAIPGEHQVMIRCLPKQQRLKYKTGKKFKWNVQSNSDCAIYRSHSGSFLIYSCFQFVIFASIYYYRFKSKEMRYFLFAIITVFVFSGCGNKTAKHTGKPLVLVSILPQKTFVEKIAGNDFDISVLIPQGANPTTYSLSPAQMDEISNAKLWFRMGYVGFELSWGEKIMQTNVSMKVIDLSNGLDLIAVGMDEATGTLKGVDPHTWLSPALVRKMAHTIHEELVLLYPENREKYNLGYQQFLKEIDEIDIKVRQFFQGFEGKPFITFHPSLSYFARDYLLEQHSVQQRGKEPTPGQIANLVKLAKENNIKVIYIQSDFDRENARMFAQETNTEIIQVWPLNPDWSDNMVYLARLLSENF